MCLLSREKFVVNRNKLVNMVNIYIYICVYVFICKTCLFLGISLEAVNFQLIRLRESHFSQPLADVFTLIALELKNFTILRMLNYSPIASKFLKRKAINNHGILSFTFTYIDVCKVDLLLR